jgi:hypothetical protein
MLGSDDSFISVHRETRERKRKSPRSARASEALHQHYYAGESRVYSYPPIISLLSSIVKSLHQGIIYAARHGAAARRARRRRRGSTSTPSAASRREAFTRRGVGGSLGVGSAGTRAAWSQQFGRLRGVLACCNGLETKDCGVRAGGGRHSDFSAVEVPFQSSSARGIQPAIRARRSAAQAPTSADTIGQELLLPRRTGA